MTDLLAIFNTFENLSDYWSREKFLKTMVELVFDCVKSSDADFLQLFKAFQEKGLLDDDENLCHFI